MRTTRFPLFVTSLVLIALGACQSPAVPVHHDGLNGTFFTRHCLRGKQERDVKVFYSTNYLSFPDVVAPGTPVEITMYSARHIDMTVDGIPSRMVPYDAPFPTNPTEIDAFLARHFEREVPAAVATDASLQKQIAAGIAPIGATKEQVMAALGYPTHIDSDIPADKLDRERILESNQWKFRYSLIAFFPVIHVYQFDTDGKLVNVIT